jgi:hypothetical protein
VGGQKNSWWRRVAGKSTQQRGMEEVPENGKESSHSAHANGMNEKDEDSSLLGCKPVSVVPNILRKHYCRHLCQAVQAKIFFCLTPRHKRTCFFGRSGTTLTP